MERHEINAEIGDALLGTLRTQSFAEIFIISLRPLRLCVKKNDASLNKWAIMYILETYYKLFKFCEFMLFLLVLLYLYLFKLSTWETSVITST